MRRQLTQTFLVGVLATFAPALASAQDAALDTKMPNVLLLVDTSGSMEYKVGLTGGVPVYPSCTTSSYERSRWVDLVEVLAGRIPDYTCEAIDRSGSAFLSEYELPGGQAPLDYQYRNPYHRPLSGTCAIGPDPSNIDPNAYKWSPPREYDTESGAACTFTSNGDGIINSFGMNVRFGLMTFDTMPDPSTGVTGTAADYTDGLQGAWSYWKGGPAQGNPVECALAPMEVGARNPAALPWEGKMIPFGAQSPTSEEDALRHDYIRKVLLSTRPYGATPIAGMLDDAHTFLKEDLENDPDTYIAPQADTFVTGGCREQVVILLTDGEPNLDLREECALTSATGPNGVCPYDEPHEIAEQLKADGIKTYVIGFAPTDIGPSIKCDEMTEADVTSPAGRCNDTSGLNEGELRQLQACCTMHQIAFAGADRPALFAESGPALREQLNVVLNEVLAGTTHSRTRPVWTKRGVYPGTFDDVDSVESYRFLTGLQVSGSRGQLWDGKLERQRYGCDADTGLPMAVPIDRDKGDDLIFSVNEAGPENRNYVTFSSTTSGFRSERTIRPALTSDPDGLGTQDGSEMRGNASTFVGLVASDLMQVDESESNCTGLTEAECAERVLKWTVGLDDGWDVSTERTGHLVGDIHHSTPRVVDRPNAVIQDETYAAFMGSVAMLERPQMLYTSSNDGFLHGFKIASNKSSDPPVENATVNPEVFAYIPPAVLTRLQTQFPGSHQRLLDGEPIVQDVIATETSANVFVFERDGTSAQAGGTSAANTWRTVLVQSFGGAWSGYFALDITNPVYTGPNTGPRLLWQITTGADGTPLFGNGGTPLITTIFDEVAGKEIAVAVLPGGNGGNPTGIGDRISTDHFVEGTGFAPRSKINTYPAAAVPARSLTIVRLDNGQILRTFRPDNSIATAMGGTAGAAFEVVTGDLAPLDSPITGRPVAFPAEVGAVADRIFVGDQDGTLWRVDVSGATPADWTMTMFFDAYAPEVAASDADTAASSGQPIATPPILSVDELGRITVNISTGDQEAVDAVDTVNYIYSLTEKLDGAGFTTQVNWFERWDDGTRVTGPMVLLQGDLYFARYTPAATADACGNIGESVIAAYKYILPHPDGDNDDGLGGMRVVDADGDDFEITDIQGAVFGLAIGQQPSCNAAESADETSPYFGGNYVKPRMSIPTAGALKLMYQTDDPNKRENLGSENSVGAATADIPVPPSNSRITSWAALVE